MSATHLKNPRFWVPYLSVPIFSLSLAFCFGERTQWYKVKSSVDSFTQIIVFCHPNLELLPLLQECGSGLTTILDKRPWDSTTSTFFVRVAFTPEEGHNALLQGWAKKG